MPLSLPVVSVSPEMLIAGTIVAVFAIIVLVPLVKSVLRAILLVVGYGLAVVLLAFVLMAAGVF